MAQFENMDSGYVRLFVAIDGDGDGNAGMQKFAFSLTCQCVHVFILLGVSFVTFLGPAIRRVGQCYQDREWL